MPAGKCQEEKRLTVCSYRAKEYDSEDGPWEPISGAASALLGTIGSLMMGVADFPVEIFKAFASKSTEELRDETDTQKLISENVSRTDSGIEPSDSASITTATSQASSNPSTATLVSSEQGVSRPSTPCSRNSGNAFTPSGLPPSSPLQQSSETQPSSAPPLHSNDEQSRESFQVTKSPETRSSKQSPHPKSPRPGSEGKAYQMSLEAAHGAGKGVSRIVGAGLKSPMDFTLGLARGFHNAPKLYGDESVRPADRITGFQSGLKAAGKVCVVSQCSGQMPNRCKGIRLRLLRWDLRSCHPAPRRREEGRDGWPLERLRQRYRGCCS